MGCFGSKQKISKVDLEYLKKHTRYDEATIKEWFKGFRVSFTFFIIFTSYFSLIFEHYATLLYSLYDIWVLFLYTKSEFDSTIRAPEIRFGLYLYCREPTPCCRRDSPISFSCDSLVAGKEYVGSMAISSCKITSPFCWVATILGYRDRNILFCEIWLLLSLCYICAPWSSASRVFLLNSIYGTYLLETSISSYNFHVGTCTVEFILDGGGRNGAALQSGISWSTEYRFSGFQPSYQITGAMPGETWLSSRFSVCVRLAASLCSPSNWHWIISALLYIPLPSSFFHLLSLGV